MIKIGSARRLHEDDFDAYQSIYGEAIVVSRIPERTVSKTMRKEDSNEHRSPLDIKYEL